MLGTIIGDMAGSPFEFIDDEIEEDDISFNFSNVNFTDDTVLTIAIASAMLKIKETKSVLDSDESRDILIKYVKEFGRRYPNAGYGGRFIEWLFSDDVNPYNSWGNGAAMRISSIPYILPDYEESIKAAEVSASITHNHPEGIKGAKALTEAIWRAKNNYNKNDIKRYIEVHYGYDLDNIPKNINKTISCQETVPAAIICFLNSISFKDSIKKAILLGGDTDTIAAMTGGIAEAYYGIPEDLQNACLNILPSEFSIIIERVTT